MSYVQAGRRLMITCPSLDGNALLLRGLTGFEALSQLFQFELDLLSEDPAVDFDSIVGKPVTITLLQADEKERYWNGYISRFSQGSQDDRFTNYRAMMVPWLWHLTRTADCRIFQEKNAPEIIQQIFKDLGFQDFKLKLYGDFVKREYCVQYRETDFNFVSRLMEEEGIYYFHIHEKGKHTLILTDDPGGHEACPGNANVQFLAAQGGDRTEDKVFDLRQDQEFRPHSYSLADYNFKTPSTKLGVSVPGREQYDIYDYPGEYGARGDGDALARIRLQEEKARRVVIRGGSDCRQFTAGYTFDLWDHYRPDLNTTYLLTAIRHVATEAGYETGGSSGSEKLTYENTFECIPYSVPFRPVRVTPQPFVQGCQTAVVVGPGGEEIYTDEFGRVKVQFHWDREGKRNESSSCWIRVSHPWAGKGWGAVSIPRIGQEVVVDFLEGDPDQPLIVGRVYNAECPAPFPLPAKACISGIKSDSTKGGGGYNQMSMDDTKGTELIHIHGQYDMDTVIEHDERILIMHDKHEVVNNDRTLQVDRDKSETVVRNKTVQIGGDQSENIDGAMSIVVGKTLTESVLINLAQSVLGAMEISVGAAMAITVGGALAETVGAVKAETIGGNKAETIGGGKTLTIGKDFAVNVGGAQSTKIAKDLTEEVFGKHRSEITKEFELTAKKVQITADDEIHFKTGSAEIILKKNGNITIKGSKINVEGSGDVIIKGSKVKAN